MDKSLGVAGISGGEHGGPGLKLDPGSPREHDHPLAIWFGIPEAIRGLVPVGDDSLDAACRSVVKSSSGRSAGRLVKRFGGMGGPAPQTGGGPGLEIPSGWRLFSGDGKPDQLYEPPATIGQNQEAKIPDKRRASIGLKDGTARGTP